MYIYIYRDVFESNTRCYCFLMGGDIPFGKLETFGRTGVRPQVSKLDPTSRLKATDKVKRRSSDVRTLRTNTAPLCLGKTPTKDQIDLSLLTLCIGCMLNYAQQPKVLLF